MIPEFPHARKPSSVSVLPPPLNENLVEAEDLPADILLPQLEGVSQTGENQWSACCPAHNDSRPSLSISETNDFKLLVYCHAGCEVEDVLAAVGMQVYHLFPTEYAVAHAKKSGKRKPVVGGQSRPGEHEAPHAEASDLEVQVLTRRHEDSVAWALDADLAYLANELSVPVQALKDFGVGLVYRSGFKCWAFPERDGRTRIVGLLYRRDYDGSKQCRRGSKRGLIMASNQPAVVPSDHKAPLYITEGHTDTIALHGVGCLAIGRPAAKLSGSAEKWLIEFLRTHPAVWQGRQIVVVGDNDAAGQAGAKCTASQLANALKTPIGCDFPPEPYKDIRDWIKAGTFKPGWPCDVNQGPLNP
jgi:hypothetical protein